MYYNKVFTEGHEALQGKSKSIQKYLGTKTIFFTIRVMLYILSFKTVQSNFVSKNKCNFRAVVKCQEAEILCKKALIKLFYSVPGSSKTSSGR